MKNYDLPWAAVEAEVESFVRSVSPNFFGVVFSFSRESILLFLMRRVLALTVLSGGNCIHPTLTISFTVRSLGAVCSCEGACLAGWYLFMTMCRDGEEGQRNCGYDNGDLLYLFSRMLRKCAVASLKVN
jgi:hypothetical protein